MAQRFVFPGLVQATCAAVFALGIGGLLIASTLREPLAVRSPATRSNLAMALAIAKVQTPGHMQAAARDLATRDPLQAAAFVMAGIGRMQRDPEAYDAVRPLMQAAIKRQPTFEAALVWLAADHARRGEYNPSLALFDRVLAGSSDQVDALLPVLTVLMQEPDSRSAVLARLNAYPPWRTAVVARGIETRALPEAVVQQLLGAAAPPRYAAKLQEERQTWIKWLIAQRRQGDAHAQYRRFVGVTADKPVYDSGFLQEKPFVPFGWTLADQAEDYAERVVTAGNAPVLRLHAGGKNVAVLLEQTLALGQGNWVISLSARDGGLARPDGQSLSLKCADQSRPLARLALSKLPGQQTTLNLPVTVPTACSLQRLLIEAEPSEDGASEIELFSLSVRRA
jgi:hypothetical protein